jgi:hypothetical protein
MRELGAAALADFNRLPLDEQLALDVRKIYAGIDMDFNRLPLDEQLALDVRKIYAGIDMVYLTPVLNRQTSLERRVEQGRGADIGAVRRRSRAKAESLGYTPYRTEEFVVYMDERYDEFSEHPELHKGRTKPTLAEIDEMFADFVVEGERARTEGFLQPNMAKWEALRDGTAFTPFNKEDSTPLNDQGEPIERPVPKPVVNIDLGPGQVALMDPNGNIGPADEEGLDAWLEANPGWKRVR